MPTIVLFDIDGTLLDAHGAGRRAMVAGFAATTGRPEGLDGILFAGMTDRSIVRTGLMAGGVEAHDELIEAVIAAYLERLPHELSARPPRVLPGVEALLDWLPAGPGVALGLGTGNVEDGARAKLRAVGLDERFAFGGFGSDHEQRDRVLEAGAERGAAALRHPREQCRVLVVGDTLRDVAAALAIGAECLAVATSHDDAPTLRRAGASEVVADLTADEARTWLAERLT